MPAAYSTDIRGRVIASVESGSSRREAAEEFDVSPSSAIKWVATYRTTGSWAAKPRGGSTSPLEKHANFLLTLIERQSDLTLDEVVCVLRKQGIRSSRTSVWRFFKRHNITFKKNPARGGAATRRRARARRRWMRAQGMFDPAHLVFLDETAANTISIERSYDRFGLSARDALECFLIELLNAYNWGSLAPPPHVVKSRGRIQVEPAKKGKSHKKQRRQEIVRPLALAEAKSIGNHPYIIAKRIKDKVNGQLKKEDRVKERVLCDDVRAILGRE